MSSILNNETNFGSFAIGTVLEVDRDTRRVAVHVSKFMPAIPGDVQFSSKSPTVSSNVAEIIGISDINPTISIRNSMWVNAWNYSNPLPKVGSKVAVSFIDDNPKNGYWNPFNPNDSYEVIDEEKFRKLFTMNVANRGIDVLEEDNVVIQFPENFTASISEQNKTKTITLFKQENYVISETEPNAPFEGMLWNDTKDIFLYRNGEFKKVLLDEDLRDVYFQLDELSKALSNVIITDRLVFIERFQDVENPFDQQVVAVDPSKSGRGFFIFRQVLNESNFKDEEDNIIVSNGIYYLTYANLLTEVRSGNEVVLEAYRYHSSLNNWERLDGWFLWTQPSTIGTLESVISEATLPQTLSFTPGTGKKIKVRDIELFNPQIDNCHVEFFANNEGVDSSVGLPFIYEKKWDSGIEVATTEPAEPENGELWYDSTVEKIFRYDTSTLDWNDGKTLLTEEPEQLLFDDGSLFVLDLDGDFTLREFENNSWFDSDKDFQYGLDDDKAVPTSANEGLYYYSTDEETLYYVVEDEEEPDEYIWEVYSNVYTIVGEDEPEYGWANGTQYYDETDNVLYTFSIDRVDPEDQGFWSQQAVPDEIPENPILGSMYFDEDDNKLYEYIVVPSWVIEIEEVDTTEPVSPENGDQWLDVTEGKLFSYSEKFLVMFDRGFDTGVSIPTEEPQSPSDGDTYFKIVSESFGYVMAFDSSDNLWTQEEEQITIIEPLDSEITDGLKWYDTDTNKLFEYSIGWDDGEVVELEEQEEPEIGDRYFDKDSGKIFYYLENSDGDPEWDDGTEIPDQNNIPENPLVNLLYFDYDTDLLHTYTSSVSAGISMPTVERSIIAEGQLWFDVDNSQLKEYEDGDWTVVDTLDTEPTNPSDGYQYFDVEDGLLYTYTEKFNSQTFEDTSLIINGNNITIVVPDIKELGVECDSLKCIIKKVGLPTASNVSLGEVTITAKSNIKEV
jgi:hypothetical protein